MRQQIEKQSRRSDKIKGVLQCLSDAGRGGCSTWLYERLLWYHKEATGRSQQTSRQVRDKDLGNILTRGDEQLKWLAQYFSELHNWPPPPKVQSILASAELNVNCGRSSKVKIVSSIKMLKRGKVAGPDNIPSEVLKADPNQSSDNLYGFFGKIWEKEEPGLSIRVATCNRCFMDPWSHKWTGLQLIQSVIK